MYVYIYPTLNIQSAYNPRSIFKQGTAGMNSEVSFSLPCCQTNAIEPSLDFPIEHQREVKYKLHLIGFEVS